MLIPLSLATVNTEASESYQENCPIESMAKTCNFIIGEMPGPESLPKLPNNYPNNINILVNEQLEYSPGITILDFESLFQMASYSEDIYLCREFHFH